MAAAFASTPAVAITGVIDYTTNEGRKIYSSATAKLDEELYNCTPDELHQFLQSLSIRAKEFGWDDEIGGILQIPENPHDLLSDTIKFIDNYGQISLEEILAFERTYINLPVRPAQDSIMLFKCLMNSISKEGKVKINTWKHQYVVEINDVTYNSGTLLLKIIVRESHLDTNATTATIRTKLSSLDTYILTIGCDIVKFNSYVQLLIDSLKARGETTQDLLTNLFKGYLAASDKTFVEYIRRKLESYEEGFGTNPDTLMQQASNKFKLLKQAGKYNAPSEDEEKLLALLAEVRSLKKITKGKGKVLFPKKATPEKSSGSAVKKGRNAPEEKPSWFFKEPKQEDLHKPRMYKDKQWYYCSSKTGGKCSGVYCRHKPSQCEGKAHKFVTFSGDSKGSPDKRKSNAKDNDRKIKLAKAMVTIQEADKDASEDDETP